MLYLLSFTVCGPVGQIGNGIANSTSRTYLSTVIYTCNKGYHLANSSYVSTSGQCQANGTWSGSMTSCVAIGISPSIDSCDYNFLLDTYIYAMLNVLIRV